LTRNNTTDQSSFDQAVVAGKPNSVAKRDDNDPSFTVVSYKKKAQAARTNDTVISTATSTNGRSSTSTNGKSSFPPVQTWGSATTTNMLVTLTTIGMFHFRIYPIIQQILESSNYQSDTFTVKWQTITTQGEPKISSTSSFRSIAKRLGLNSMDITGYCHFIESCPSIENHVVIMDSATANTFNYHMNPNRFHASLSFDKPFAEKANAESGDTADNEEIDIPDPSIAEKVMESDMVTTVTTIESVVELNLDTTKPSITKTTDSKTLVSCYSNNGDFTMMLELFWPTSQAFLTQYPNHEHTKQWRHWMKEGLTPTTDLATAKIILNLSTLDQIYLLFCDSPAIHGFFEIT